MQTATAKKLVHNVYQPNEFDFLENALVKKDASLDRCGIVFLTPTSDQAYSEACHLMDAQLSEKSISRYIVRGVVDANFDEHALISSLGSEEGIVELNKLPINPTKNFLWIARNSQNRSLNSDQLQRLMSKINGRVCHQFVDVAVFQGEADRLYETAIRNKFRIVCNDPTGDLGKNRINPEIYTSLMRGYFYTSRATCAKYLDCHGHSTSWHYLFGLTDADNNQLGMFMMAKWPWGIEATYTIFQRGVPKNLNCAPLLMLFAMSLVLEKHPKELVYGEANTFNAGPCIQSGLHALPASLTADFVTNVETVDNAIRLDGALTEYAPDLIIPSYRAAQYASYGVHELRKCLFTPRIASQAKDLLC